MFFSGVAVACMGCLFPEQQLSLPLLLGMSFGTGRYKPILEGFILIVLGFTAFKGEGSHVVE